MSESLFYKVASLSPGAPLAAASVFNANCLRNILNWNLWIHLFKHFKLCIVSRIRQGIHGVFKNYRSSHSTMFFKIGVLKNRFSLFNKVAGRFLRTVFYRTPPESASGISFLSKNLNSP